MDTIDAAVEVAVKIIAESTTVHVIYVDDADANASVDDQAEADVELEG
jgi:hypothetical protein